MIICTTVSNALTVQGSAGFEIPIWGKCVIGKKIPKTINVWASGQGTMLILIKQYSLLMYFYYC